MDNKTVAQTFVHLNQMAMQEVREENYEKAIYYFTQSLVLEEKLGMREQMAESFHNLANTYLLMKDYEQALRKVKMALILRHQTGQKDEQLKLENLEEHINEMMTENKPMEGVEK